MTNLLSLPRELRDEIFSWLLAPNGTITLIPHLGRRRSPVTILSSRAVHDESDDIPRRKTDLRCLRTCWQVYEECRDVLFKQNVWFFPSPGDAVRVMNEMGQKQSRRIQKTMVDFSKELRVKDAEELIASQIHLPASETLTRRSWTRIDRMGKVLRKTLSRSRQGSLRELIIRIDGPAILSLGCLAEERYEDLLSIGGVIEHWGKLQRSIVVEMSDAQHQMFDRAEKHRLLGDTCLDFILMKMHFSWGGKLLLNGQLIWVDFCRVAEIPVKEAKRRKDFAIDGGS